MAAPPAKGAMAASTRLIAPAKRMPLSSARDRLPAPKINIGTASGISIRPESAAPPQPGMTDGIMGYLMKLGMWWAGAGGESPNRITLLRDGDGDGEGSDRRVISLPKQQKSKEKQSNFTFLSRPHDAS